MKRFVGGSDGQVAMLDERGITWLGCFEWGDQGAPCANLAKSLLAHVLDDSVQVDRLYRRFMYRTVAGFSKGKPWSKTDAQLLTVVDDIEKVERETAVDARRMARELPRGAINEAAAAGIPDTTEWGGTHNRSNKAPEIQRNDPRKAK